ncbi:MAG: hypothetical protein ACQCXQ_00135, partial [Verrucomicrobiales bacterium]
MPENPTEPAIDGDLTDGGDTAKYGRWGAVLLTVLVLVWFYGFESRYGPRRFQSAFDWILSAWNGENDYEHGPLFPLVIAGLIVHRFKSLKASVSKGV